MAEEDTKRKKRIVLIGTSSFLLVAMVVAVTVGMHNGGEEVNEKTRMASTVKAVKTFCSPTNYKEECEKSLMSEVGSTTDSRELMKLAFNITIRKIKKGMKQTHLLEEVEKDPRAKKALNTCRKLMDISIFEFERSLNGIKSFTLNNLENIVVSLKVWLSGAMTYQETCLDGFANITSDSGTKMKNILQTSRRMSSNALAVVSDLEKAVKDFNITKDDRRRIDDYKGSYVGEQVVAHDDVNEVPSWVGDGSSAGIRRLLQVAQNKLKANAVVAQDGSGKFRTINDALKQVPLNSQKPYVIYIKEGVYREYIEITILMTNIVFVGDGEKKTIITGNKNMVDGIPTYATPTVAIGGDFFVGMNLGIENSAGLFKDQAVALRVQGDKTILYRCSIDGYQDTLYAHTMRQFYRDCSISGTIDFVFGNAQAVFQNCTFIVRKPLDHQQCIIVAQGRSEELQPSGIIIQNSKIVSETPNAAINYKAYLGRPWKHYARTIFMDTFIGDVIQPEGYMPWVEPDNTLSGMDTCFYAELDNTGPGSDKTKRVKWQGIRNLTDQSANVFYPSLFFQGDDWIKNTKIPYTSGEITPKPNPSGETTPKPPTPNPNPSGETTPKPNPSSETTPKPPTPKPNPSSETTPKPNPSGETTPNPPTQQPNPSDETTAKPNPSAETTPKPPTKQPNPSDETTAKPNPSGETTPKPPTKQPNPSDETTAKPNPSGETTPKPPTKQPNPSDETTTKPPTKQPNPSDDTTAKSNPSGETTPKTSTKQPNPSDETTAKPNPSGETTPKTPTKQPNPSDETTAKPNPSGETTPKPPTKQPNPSDETTPKLNPSGETTPEPPTQQPKPSDKTTPKPNPSSETTPNTPTQQPNPSGETTPKTPTQQPNPSGENTPKPNPSGETTPNPPTQQPNPSGEATPKPPTQQPNPSGEATPKPNPSGETTPKPPTQQPNPSGEATPKPPTQQPNPSGEVTPKLPTQQPNPSGETTPKPSTQQPNPYGETTPKPPTQQPNPCGETTPKPPTQQPIPCGETTPNPPTPQPNPFGENTPMPPTPQPNPFGENTPMPPTPQPKAEALN